MLFFPLVDQQFLLFWHARSPFAWLTALAAPTSSWNFYAQLLLDLLLLQDVQMDFNEAIFVGELQAVADEVDNDLLDAAFIPNDSVEQKREVWIELEIETNFLAFCLVLEHFEYWSDRVNEIEFLEVEPKHGRLDRRHVE